MSLTSAQLTTLKADIVGDPTLSQIPNTPDGDYTIAQAYNAAASPAYYVWRTSVNPAEYAGNNGIVWTEVDGLTVGKARIFEWLTGGLTKPINASDPNVRAGINNAFGQNSTTLANLTALATRVATRVEKLFATGTGTQAVPAMLTFEGVITYVDVQTARSM